MVSPIPSTDDVSCLRKQKDAQRYASTYDDKMSQNKESAFEHNTSCMCATQGCYIEKVNEINLGGTK